MTAIALAILLATAHAKPTARVVSIAKLPASATMDAITERKERRVPLGGDPKCRDRFRIDKITFTIDLTDASSTIFPQVTITLTKLFAGRGATPTVVVQTAGEVPPVSFGFDIDADAWPRKGYVISSTFTDPSVRIAAPSKWARIILGCE